MVINNIQGVMVKSYGDIQGVMVKSYGDIQGVMVKSYGDIQGGDIQGVHVLWLNHMVIYRVFMYYG